MGNEKHEGKSRRQLAYDDDVTSTCTPQIDSKDKIIMFIAVRHLSYKQEGWKPWESYNYT